MDLAAIRADRARRRALRPRDVGLQGERDQPRRRAARLGRQAAGRHQGHHRRPGGSRRRRPARVPRRASRGRRVRRDGDRRHGQRARPACRRSRSRCAGWRWRRSRSRTLKGGQAQRAVRRRRPGRAARGPARARLAARRQRRRGGRRPGPRGVDGRVLQRRGVPRARRGAARAAAAGDGRARLARLVGAGDHGHGHRRAVGGERAQRRVAVRAREAQPARAPRAGRHGGAGGARASTCGPCGRSGSRSRCTRGETGNGFSADTTGPAYEAARAAWSAAWGTPAVNAARRRVDPARQRAPGAPRRRPRSLLVGATDGYANIHAPDERVLLDELEKATVAPRPRSSASTRSAGAEPMADTIVPDRRPAAPSRRGMERVLDGIERLGQQDARPGDPVPLALRRRDRALAGRSPGSTSRRPTRSSSRRRCRPRRPTTAAPPSPSTSRPTSRSRPTTTRCGTETTRGQGPADRRRRPLPVHVVRRQLPQLRGRHDHPRGDDRRRPGRGRRADRRADPQARRGLLGRHADVHHRAARHDLQRRLRRGLPRADTPRARWRSRASGDTRWPASRPRSPASPPASA